MDSGAHFQKCEFQAHSPRDPSWSGPRPTSDADRRAFGDRFVAACRQKGLQAVAITDHHDVAFVDYIREAAANETDVAGVPLKDEQRLVVFPGIELTLGAPCQALLILDADFPSDRLPDVLTALSIEAALPAEASATPPEQLGHIHDFKTLYELLDRHAWLRGRYAVFPHAADGGHGTLIRKGFHEKYKEMPCVGAYTDGPASKLGEGSTKILSGADKLGAISVSLSSRPQTPEPTPSPPLDARQPGLSGPCRLQKRFGKHAWRRSRESHSRSRHCRTSS